MMKYFFKNNINIIFLKNMFVLCKTCNIILSEFRNNYFVSLNTITTKKHKQFPSKYLRFIYCNKCNKNYGIKFFKICKSCFSRHYKFNFKKFTQYYSNNPFICKVCLNYNATTLFCLTNDITIQNLNFL